MSKVGQIILLLVMSLSSFQTQALWFDIPSADKTLSYHGHIEESFKPALNPDRIEVLVWNIYKGGLLGWRIDLQRYVQFQDIVILQEGLLNDAMKSEFDASKRLQYTFATSFIFKSSGHPTGVVTASRVAASSVEYQRSEKRELIGFTPKMVLINTFPIQNSSHELMTINIHALNSVSWKSMAGQVINALKVAKEHNGPVIFAGDFNTWSDKKMKFLLRSMKRAGFSAVEFPNGFERMHVLGRPLDHIYIRGLGVRYSRVLAEATGSDHKPLQASLFIDRQFLNQ